jgi:hypothetical protein
MTRPDEKDARRQLEVVCQRLDRTSRANSKLLRHLAEKALAGKDPTAQTIAQDYLLCKQVGPEEETRARAAVAKLRRELSLYYATIGKDDAVVFQLPKGRHKVEWDFPTPNGQDEADQETPWAILDRCGLRHAFRIKEQNPERLRRVTELVKEESRRRLPHFRLAASSGHSYLHSSTGPVWCSGLGDAIVKKGARLDVVLESPFSDFAECRALANGVPRHHWHTKVDVDALQDLLKERPDQVSIQVTDIPVSCSLFFTSKSVFYDPYLWARPSPAYPTENNFWVFEFTKASEPDFDCYDLLEKHFIFLRENSIPLNEFLSLDPPYEERTALFEARMRDRLEQAKKSRAIALGKE